MDAPTPSPSESAALAARERAIKGLKNERASLARTIEKNEARIAIINEQLGALEPQPS